MIDLFTQVIGERQAGKIFNVQEHEMSVLNRRALNQVIPELAPKIEMPNHFWRHMFAQHMLRRTNWNYAKVASLGNWTIGALQESYGQPPQEIVEQWGKEATIDLTVI
jgi:hypothetical protein